MHPGAGRVQRWWQRAARRLPGAVLLAAACVLVAACSESAFGDLGQRSSGWIGEVATTATTTTTTAPALIHPARDVEWVNDTFGAPASELEPSAVLAAAFARSEDSSRFLQASRQEIAVVAPEARFPEILPADVAFITSQLVIETRELTLSNDPTIAFGLWTVEPYTRSRSIGQMGVLNLSTDPGGTAAAIEDEEGVCLSITVGETECALERLESGTVWRLENAAGVTHVWYTEPFRYELEGLDGLDEDLVHDVIDSVVLMADLLPEE